MNRKQVVDAIADWLYHLSDEDFSAEIKQIAIDRKKIENKQKKSQKKEAISVEVLSKEIEISALIKL